MSAQEPYKSNWPEVLLLNFAGFSKALGAPLTDGQAAVITELAGAERGGSGEPAPPPLRTRVENAFKPWLSPDNPEDNERLDHIRDLYILLGDGETPAEREEEFDTETLAAMERQYPALSNAKRLTRCRNLRKSYDWGTLRRIIHSCPYMGKDSPDGKDFVSLQDLFTLIDLHIREVRGFHLHDNREPRFISPECMLPARNALVLTIYLMMNEAYRKLEHNPFLGDYYRFAEILANLMRREAIAFDSAGYPIDDRKFFMFSYSIISFNWDPIFMWLIFNAHRNLNEDNKPPVLGSPPRPVKTFHDLGHFTGVRQVDSDRPNVWFPMNESSVQRINDRDHNSSRIIRVGHYIYPHGSNAWRECPNCGKDFLNFGDEWSPHSPSLFSPPLLPNLSIHGFSNRARSPEEKEAHDNGIADAIQCPYCGAMTELRHTQMIMQSAFKGGYPPCVEDNQRITRILLENAKHVVFNGTAFAIDDMIYRGIYATRRPDKEDVFYSIINFVDGAEDRWLYGDEIDEFCKNTSSNEFKSGIKNAKSILRWSKDNVRVYAKGMPDVIKEGGVVSENRVIDLLYPERFGLSFPMSR